MIKNDDNNNDDNIDCHAFVVFVEGISQKTKIKLNIFSGKTDTYNNAIKIYTIYVRELVQIVLYKIIISNGSIKGHRKRASGVVLIIRIITCSHNFSKLARLLYLPYVDATRPLS